MKQVTFGKSTRPSKNYTMCDLRDQVIAFLTAHGMNQSYASEITSVEAYTDYIYINPGCANSGWTRALALLQLIFSEPLRSFSEDSMDAKAYIAYRPNEGGMRLTLCSDSDFGDVIDYIKDHMEISIS